MEELVQEIRIIRWLLIAIIVLVAFVVLLIFSTFRSVSEAMSDDVVESTKFKNLAETYDSQGKHKSLLAHCERRLKKYPNDKWALYYLGVATLRLEKYAEAKAHFTKLRDLDPQWNEVVVDYLDEIHEKISRNKPKSV